MLITTVSVPGLKSILASVSKMLCILIFLQLTSCTGVAFCVCLVLVFGKPTPANSYCFGQVHHTSLYSRIANDSQKYTLVGKKLLKDNSLTSPLFYAIKVP